jgi:hypothetical protein
MFEMMSLIIAIDDQCVFETVRLDTAVVLVSRLNLVPSRAQRELHPRQWMVVEEDVLPVLWHEQAIQLRSVVIRCVVVGVSPALQQSSSD